MPTYNEEGNVDPLYDRLRSVADGQQDVSFEFLFVDDCSSDGTSDKLAKLAEQDSRVKVVRFARNFGSHAACAAGLCYCQGAAAVVMAADLQDPPELIPDLLEQWRSGHKVVWAARKEREGESAITIGFARLYYWLMNTFADVRLPEKGADVLLVDRAVVQAFKESPEKHTSVHSLIAWLGFPQTMIEYVKEARHAGQSKWTLRKKVKLLVDSFLSFSYVPMRLMSVVGGCVAALGFLYAIVVVLNWLFIGRAVGGWSSLMVVVLLLGGVQMLMLGVLGEYLWRTFDECRKRPRYVVENTVNLNAPEGPVAP